MAKKHGNFFSQEKRETTGASGQPEKKRKKRKRPRKEAVFWRKGLLREKACGGGHRKRH